MNEQAQVTVVGVGGGGEGGGRGPLAEEDALDLRIVDGWMDGSGVSPCLPSSLSLSISFSFSFLCQNRSKNFRQVQS